MRKEEATNDKFEHEKIKNKIKDGKPELLEMCKCIWSRSESRELFMDFRNV